ncbi:MAG: phosphoglycolate phosphatase, bacterial [Planctomycetota bacterium]|nr:MAG: phosphoglycolate phosphatase, bacterial [Planctomycetota bacterium]
MRYRTLLFDLDGTLVDSSRDLAAAVNAARQSFGLAPLELATVRAHIGDGMRRLVERSVPGVDLQAAVERFCAAYERCLLETTRPYPGIPEVLAALAGAGCRMAVVTNKAQGFSERILEGLGLAPWFGAVIGGDGPAGRKPHPAPLHAALRALGAPRAGTLMIGDGPADIGAARALGVPVCGVLYGIGAPPAVRALQPDHLIERPRELADLVLRL